MSSSGEWRDELAGENAEDVRGLLRAAQAEDGRPEVGATGPLPREFDGGAHFVLREGADGGGVLGYLHLDQAGDAYGRQVAELIVHPAHRRRGHGTALLQALDQRAAEGYRVWAHGDHPGAAGIATHAGLARQRELLVLRAGVEGAEWPEPVLCQGITLRTFVPGQDEDAVVKVNARAFSWHPEQGALTADDIRAEERNAWFDPQGFFLAENAEKTVVGFHWTKVHEPVPGRFDGEAVGEVYVVGVDPDAQGGGLGRALTLAGLRHLAEKGLRQVILYVEGDNAPALAVYTRLGFVRFETDVQYGR